jgi:hypothetical protein
VLVLEAPKELGWKEGTQAVVAELLTSGYELNVRATKAKSAEELGRELELQVGSSRAFAGLSVLREGESATALLCRRGAAECERVSVTISEGELSRSRLAVAVVQRLRPLDLPAAPEPPPAPPAAPPPPPKVEAPRVAVQPSARPRPRPLRVWLGGGVTLSSGTSRPLSWLGASLASTFSSPWGVELGVGGSPLPGRAESYAGTLSLRAFQAIALASFEPHTERRLGFGLGLGGGVVRLEEVASPAPGFDGFSQYATVGVVTARARLFLRLGAVRWGVSVDPGMLVPSVRVEAGSETVHQMGRPWLSLQTSLGVPL